MMESDSNQNQMIVVVLIIMSIPKIKQRVVVSSGYIIVVLSDGKSKFLRNVNSQFFDFYLLIWKVFWGKFKVRVLVWFSIVIKVIFIAYHIN